MKTETRGRKAEPEIKLAPIHETKEFTDKKTGIKTVWIWDRSISKLGPISVETFYPSDNEKLEDVPVVVKGEKVSKSGKVFLTSQKWINPKNGKEVGYTRAKMLGLI